MSTLISLRSVSVYARSAVARSKCLLDQVSFDINAGEFAMIVGPNGAGKTTVLRAIIGLIQTTHGCIEKAKDLSIGYMPQRLDLNEMMPLDVMTFLSLSKDLSNLENIIKETGIDLLLGSSMHDLSGGERQRVLLAKALMQKPNLLILDEPTQGLDQDGEKRLLALVEHLNKHHGIAVLMVSHDLHYVHQASDKVISLNKHVCAIDIKDLGMQKPVSGHDGHPVDKLIDPKCAAPLNNTKKGNPDD